MLQSYGPTVHLTVVRDRLVGIALGLTVFWVADSRLWPVRAVERVRERLAGALRALADLVPLEEADGAGARCRAIRGRVSGDLAAVQQLLVETKFERDIEDRDALERMFAASQTVLLLVVARSSPPSVSARHTANAAVREAWKHVDDALAGRLRGLADLVAGTASELGPDPATAVAALERAIAESPAPGDAALRGHLALDRRLVETMARVAAAPKVAP